MKIVAFAATNSKKSLNNQLIHYASALIKSEILQGADIEIIDLNDFEMPIYSIDREQDSGIPALAHRFFDTIGASDALIISYAEHNGCYTTAFKNILDWISRINMRVFQDKPMVILSASVGIKGGSSVMRIAQESAPFFGAIVKSTLSIGSFNDNFDNQSGKLTNATLNQKLKLALQALIPIEKLQS
ncbi:MAG: NAD(P)H-dependent oxidoreductase [Alphaproteobacteria bacterium]|nr:MAG: NAD(P)H-dependent oxidoreductase [Alphaproteobacteria bacterium]